MFEQMVVNQFIAQVLGSSELYETEAVREPVRVIKGTEEAAYAAIRGRGYQG